MTLASNLYPHTNMMLYAVISTYEYLRADMSGGNILLTRHDWVNQTHGLAAFVLDEYFEFPKERTIEEVDAFGDKLIFYWSEQLFTHSEQLHLKQPELDTYTILYFTYLRWFQKILVIFDQLMHEDTLRTSLYYQRYIENLSLFREFAQSLKSEQATKPSHISSIWDEIEQHSTRLAEHWKLAVLDPTNF